MSGRSNNTTTIKIVKGNRKPVGAVNAGSGPVAVSASDLARWMTAQFQSYPGCSQVRVEGVVRLARPDKEGCNWSRTLILDTAGVPPKVYAQPYAAIVLAGRKRFRLA
jgi:hypothetical protein